MASDVVISKIRKSSSNEVHVAIREYAGNHFCDVREHFHPEDKPDWLPTKKGVSIPLDLLPAAVDAVEALAAKDGLGNVGEIPKGRHTKICFGMREFRKHVYGDVRLFYTDDEGSEKWKPGKGVTLPPGLLGQLAEALRLAEDYVADNRKTLGSP